MDSSIIKRRTFFKTCGLALAGLEFPVSNSVCANLEKDETLFEKGVNVSMQLPCNSQHFDYVVVGGGVAGVCSAITAARTGLKVALIQDRPVLGGNASSEVRLWILGATSHMNNNNRWSREGGVLNEIVVENLYRNKEGNSIFFDALLLEKVWAEPNILLLLNTAVYSVEMNNGCIKSVDAYCSQNETQYKISAPLFCDASGDGIIGFMSGAAFRIGTEVHNDLGEKFILPEDFGKLLGHSMYFYSKDVGHPVKYVAPSFALKDIENKIPRFKDIHRDSSGCNLWWLEWGDNLDHVFDSEIIKNELWKVVYGVWDYIKNSGNFNDVDNLTLEWISTIPGKRESRRFEGDYMLRQQDVVEQHSYEDSVAYGGWAIDLHPAAGVYSSYPGCTQYHSKGIYEIPYRCIYSRNIPNLFLGGRLISVSHIAFGSTRVIATGTLCAQAAALAAHICIDNNILPHEIYSKGFIHKLRMDLMQTGQYIPHVKYENENDLVEKGKITVSERLKLADLSADGTWKVLQKDTAMLLPFSAGEVSEFTFTLDSKMNTSLCFEFYSSSRMGNFTPDVCLAQKEYTVSSGVSHIKVNVNVKLKASQYCFVVLKKNVEVSVALSSTRLTGVLSLFNSRMQKENSNYGFEKINFFVPERRPLGKNLAIKIEPALDCFDVSQLITGVFRPTGEASNAWVAPLSCKTARLTCSWKTSQNVKHIVLWFDVDYDHAMETCLMEHNENVVPFCVKHYKIEDQFGNVLYEENDNHQAKNDIIFEKEVTTNCLHVELSRNDANIPISLLGIQIFG